MTHDFQLTDHPYNDDERGYEARCTACGEFRVNRTGKGYDQPGDRCAVGERVLAEWRKPSAWPRPEPGDPCPNCGGGGIDTITDDVGSTIVQPCEDCLGTGRLPA